jgi:hypothetical protein
MVKIAELRLNWFLRDKNTSFDNPALTSIFRDAEDLVEERFTALQARGFKSLITTLTLHL